MFTPEQTEKLEAVLRRASEDKEYCAELGKNPIAVLKDDADLELPSEATTRTVMSDGADFTIILPTTPGSSAQEEPILVVIDQPGDYDDANMAPLAHLGPAIPQIVEKSMTDSTFRSALIADPIGALQEGFGIEVSASLQVVDPLAADYTLITPSSTSDFKPHPVIALPGLVHGNVDPERTGAQLFLASEMAGELSGAELGAIAGGTTTSGGKGTKAQPTGKG